MVGRARLADAEHATGAARADPRHGLRLRRARVHRRAGHRRRRRADLDRGAFVDDRSRRPRCSHSPPRRSPPARADVRHPARAPPRVRATSASSQRSGSHSYRPSSSVLLDVLVPLSLDAAGWGTIAIAVTFIVAGLVEVALAPVIGGISDRRGRLYPDPGGPRAARRRRTGVRDRRRPRSSSPSSWSRASLAASGIYTPGIALVSDRAEANHLPQTLAFGVMNTAWAIGAMVGPGGRRGTRAGDRRPSPLPPLRRSSRS